MAGWAVQGIVGCLAASLASTQQVAVVRSLCLRQLHNQNISRQFPGKQNIPSPPVENGCTEWTVEKGFF